MDETFVFNFSLQPIVKKLKTIFSNDLCRKMGIKGVRRSFDRLCQTPEKLLLRRKSVCVDRRRCRMIHRLSNCKILFVWKNPRFFLYYYYHHRRESFVSFDYEIFGSIDLVDLLNPSVEIFLGQRLENVEKLDPVAYSVFIIAGSAGVFVQILLTRTVSSSWPRREPCGTGWVLMNFCRDWRMIWVEISINKMIHSAQGFFRVRSAIVNISPTRDIN